MLKFSFDVSPSDFIENNFGEDWHQASIDMSDIKDASFSELDHLYKFWTCILRTGIYVMTHCSIGGREGNSLSLQIDVAFENCNQIEKAIFFRSLENTNTQDAVGPKNLPNSLLNPFDLVKLHGSKSWKKHIIKKDKISKSDHDSTLDLLDYWKQVLNELRVLLLLTEPDGKRERIFKNVNITFDNIQKIKSRLWKITIDREYDFSDLGEMRR